MERPALEKGALNQQSLANKLVLIAVNPYVVHAYWDVDQRTVPAGKAPAALRFHDLEPGQPESCFDVPVELGAGNWYVHLWSPARTYRAELGFKTVTGEFAALADSNIVQTPRAWPIAEINEVFVRIGEETPVPALAESRASAEPSPRADIVALAQQATVAFEAVQNGDPLSGREVEPAFGPPEIGPVELPRFVSRATAAGPPAPVPGPVCADLTAQSELRFQAGLSSGCNR